MNPGCAFAHPGLRTAATIAAMLLAGCAAKPFDPYDGKTVSGHGMSPYVILEECVKVAAGERIDYSFTSTLPVDFNIHYHEGATVIMPIVRDKTLVDGAIFAAVIPQEYCLMWEAGATGTTLDYRLRLRAPAPP